MPVLVAGSLQEHRSQRTTSAVRLSSHGALLPSPPKWRAKDFGDEARDILEYNVHACLIFNHLPVCLYLGERIPWRVSCDQKDPVLATDWPGPQRLDDDVHLFGQPVPAVMQDTGDHHQGD